MDVCRVVDECSSETREGEWRGREDRKRAKPREREEAGFIADSGGEKGRVREKREKKRRKKVKKD